MAHWNARAGIKECKRMADAGSITNFIVGWKVEASLLCGGSWAALEPKWRNAKKWFAHLPWACLHMAQGRAPFQRLCPHPRHLWSNDQWLWIRTTWIMAALQKPEQIWTNFSYNPEITIKWGEWPPEGAPLEVHKTKYSRPWPLSFYRGYVHGYIYLSFSDGMTEMLYLFNGNFWEIVMICLGVLLKKGDLNQQKYNVAPPR